MVVTTPAEVSIALFECYHLSVAHFCVMCEWLIRTDGVLIDVGYKIGIRWPSDLTQWCITDPFDLQFPRFSSA